MTTTRVAALQRVSEEIDDWYTADTTGAGDTDTVVDTGLKNLPNGDDDDAFNGYYIRITESGHGAVGEIRRINDYTASTGTCDMESAFSASIGSGVAYELHRIHPQIKIGAIERACATIFPDLYLPLRDETLVVDNLLSNGDMETYSGGFTGWTEVGSPTVTQETSRVWHGSGAAKIVSAAGAAGQLTQAPTVNVSEIASVTATLRARGWADTASVARVRIDWDGSSFENGDYHTGDSSWRLLTASAAVPSDATQVKAILEVVAGSQTAYFDKAELMIRPVYRYTVPSSMVRGPFKVLQQYTESLPSGPYYPVHDLGSPSGGRILRLEGMGLLTTPTADTSAIEVDEPHLSLFVAEVMLHIYRVLKNRRLATLQRGAIAQLESDWRLEKEAMLRRPGVRMPKMSAQVSSAWHIDRDSSGKYLVFDNPRDSMETLELS